MGKLRFDLVFSYWIFFWFLLYVFKFTKLSPKFAFILGVIENCIMFILMLLFGTSRKTMVVFAIINILIKVVPLYYLRNVPIKMVDIYATIILFILFVIWLHINRQSLVGNLAKIYYSLLYGKNETPFIVLLLEFQKKFKNYKII